MYNQTNPQVHNPQAITQAPLFLYELEYAIQVLAKKNDFPRWKSLLDHYFPNTNEELLAVETNLGVQNLSLHQEGLHGAVAPTTVDPVLSATEPSADPAPIIGTLQSIAGGLHPLFDILAEANYLDVVKKLIAFRRDKQQKLDSLRTAICSFICCGHSESVEDLLAGYPAYYGEMLHYAIVVASLDKRDLLVDSLLAKALEQSEGYYSYNLAAAISAYSQQGDYTRTDGWLALAKQQGQAIYSTTLRFAIVMLRKIEDNAEADRLLNKAKDEGDAFYSELVNTINSGIASTPSDPDQPRPKRSRDAEDMGEQARKRPKIGSEGGTRGTYSEKPAVVFYSETSAKQAAAPAAPQAEPRLQNQDCKTAVGLMPSRRN